MSYRIEFAPAAARQLRKLERATQARLIGGVESLSEDPRGPGVTTLVGTDDLYRLRVGDYRVIYQIRDRALVVLVLKIAHRREVYR